jgi:hypothetical protein
VVAVAISESAEHDKRNEPILGLIDRKYSALSATNRRLRSARRRRKAREMDKIIYSGPFGVGVRKREQRYATHCRISIESAPLQVKVKLITGHGDVTAEISPGDALTAARELKIAAELALDSADYEREIYQEVARLAGADP